MYCIQREIIQKPGNDLPGKKLVAISLKVAFLLTSNR